MNIWPFPIQSARDHLSTSRHQGRSVLGSLESTDLHPWDESEGDAGYGGSTLLLTLFFIVDHHDLHVGSLPVLVLPLLPMLLCVGHAGSCESLYHAVN